MQAESFTGGVLFTKRDRTLSNKLKQQPQIRQTDYLTMNLHHKSPIFTGAIFLFLVSFVNPTLASDIEAKQYIAQSRTIEAKSAQKEILYLNNDRTYNYNLIATQKGTIGNVSVPVGATIVGKYVPSEGGLRYEAQAVTYDQYSYRVSAQSETLTDVKDPRDTSTGAVAEDAGIGAAGGVVLGEVLGGGANVEEAVGGAAAGAATGNLTAERVVVVKPDESIVLYAN